MESREQINAVWQMQNYIEGHLDEPITLHALAKSAGYSPWHCARIFKELTGKAPFEYIRMYRLSKAAMELRDNDIKVVDVAMDFLFDSHEGFTRAFRRQFGMSPNEYKKNTPPIYLFHPWSIREYYYWLRDMQEDAPPLSGDFFVQVRNFPKRKLLLKRGVSADDYFSYSNENGCGGWGLLCSVRTGCMNQSACGFLTRCVHPVPHAMHRALNYRRTTEERSRRALISLICPNVK